MQIQITFSTSANRNAFAAKTGYTTAEQTTLTAHAALLGLAKSAEGFVSAEQAEAGTNEFIVKSDNIAGLASIATELENLGNGFYRVSSTDFIALYNANPSAEPAVANIKLLSELTGPTIITDPLTAAGQWARIRVSNKNRPFSSTFATMPTTAQRTPEVIVMDSGINSHAEFANVTVENFYKLPSFADYSDEAGHGTAVASAIAGANVGVSTHSKLVNCKIFTATYKPTLLELGAAMDAILARHTADSTTARVVNMSWNTTKSAYLESKIDALCQAGIIVVAAAGNDGIDVANLTPAGMAQVITVAASDIDDVAAGFNDFAAADATITTNSGRFLDFFAPGVAVTVAHRNGGYIAPSGSSFSAGYASGCVAELLSVVPSWPQSFTTIIDFLNTDATSGVLLLDPALFTSNQNKVIHLSTGINNKLYEFDYYMGAFSETSEPTISVSNLVDFYDIPFLTGQETRTFSIVWEDPALEADYASFVVIDSTNGALTITKPTVALDPSVNLQLVRFKVNIATNSVSLTSNGLIFFYANPSFTGDVSTELASALEDLNSQSFFAAWSRACLK
jgi:subtilisin family serine protease